MLSMTYSLSDDLPLDAPIRVTETRGSINYQLHHGLFLPPGVAALNAVSAALVAGGQWFQLWKGEIISVNSPPTPRGHDDGWLHRGPLAHQEAGPRHR